MSTKAPPLFAAREPIFPRRVSGFFRRLKWVILILTLGIYYVTPWIRWDRGPNLPDQAVLVDLANRRFHFFWIEIWPHEFYLVAGLLIMAGLGLFLFTSALGRVWCGYACPQTVWSDLFMTVERWIEGDRNARIRLHKAPMSLRKARLRVAKWAVWLVIAVATGGAWVFYFADAPTLARDLVTLEAAPVAYATIAVLTATTFIFGGFMREQVCIYMCPWPRIQGAMMDPGTLTVGYRRWRGEPRGKGGVKRAQAAAEAIGSGEAVARYGAALDKDSAAPRTARDGGVLGDCIDCNACVAVCPMGIDIREGQQMECITCALCIDACDDVMAKIGRPRGLIDYLALDDEPPVRPGESAAVAGLAEAPAGTVAGATGPAWRPKPLWQHVFRPRTVLYTLAWAAIGVALVVALFIRPEIDMTVAPVRNPTFVTLSDGSIRNAYDIRLRNKHGEARDFRLSLGAAEGLKLALEGVAGPAVTVPPDSTQRQRVYVIAPRETPAAERARSDLRFWVQDVTSGERAHGDTIFHGKE
ncbi:iron-sulfur-binding protein, RdxA/RdxB/FixG family protein [Pseudooceanicola batsensis HTCC2597]|uniref:Iron-sulfur-binding protein, RdxA/RdxB/FixG family protein n=1 Tax=Pseudooceanicola batsensis (strain ATCC BAA-863 / DSM 15984 / KCTC 12145 / HTCC2597) TaxID=252305 RepID=A3U178_PSEBH|nr:cytochrome c oxidase accessory protein CcoG [Pseudooceanicola batsensis]EAQ02061.1 iron-sulfur-binding protein, RdxA/RdxB/FixG family protein [Pseudooceanicola batsensis HTCC2597]